MFRPQHTIELFFSSLWLCVETTSMVFSYSKFRKFEYSMASNCPTLIGKGVQQKPRPDSPIQPVKSDLRTSQPDADDGRRRVSASRTRKQRVGWRVFSPKHEETRLNRGMEHFPEKFFRFDEISARSMESPSDLARSH